MKRTHPITPTLEPGTRRMFSYLDGELGADERAAFKNRMSLDPRLAAETEAYRSLMATLDRLAPFAPSRDFAIRVMASLNVRRSWQGRLYAWLAGSPYPVAANVFADLIDNRLPARQAKALSDFAGRNPEAAAALAEWKQVYERLDQLPGFAPAPGFGSRVMARLRTAPAPAGRTAAMAGWIRGLWPRRSERLAAASGIAFGPTAVIGVTAYMVFSNNPLVTAANLASFMWVKGTAALSGVAERLFSSTAGGVFGNFDMLAAPGPALAASLIVFGGLTLFSVWVLYRNVLKISGLKSRYVAV